MNGIQNSYTIPNYHHALILGHHQCPFIAAPGAAWATRRRSQGYDSALDTLAAKLNMGPYDLRMKNVRDPSLPAQDSTKRVWGGTAIPTILQTLHDQSGYATKWHAPGTKTMPDGRMHGIGLVAHIDSHGSVNGASRYMSMVMTGDGKVLVNVGGARGSEGAETAMVIFVAEAMGMTYEDVRCGEWGNTDTTLTAGIQAGSGFTAGAGYGRGQHGTKGPQRHLHERTDQGPVLFGHRQRRNQGQSHRYCSRRPGHFHHHHRWRRRLLQRLRPFLSPAAEAPRRLP